MVSQKEKESEVEIIRAVITTFRLGMWHRLKDAIIPYTGLTYKGLQLGCSFDYTTSAAKTKSQIRNTFEISSLYLAEDKSEIKRLIPWY